MSTGNSTQATVLEVYRAARLGETETPEDVVTPYEVSPRSNQIAAGDLLGLFQTVFGLGGAS
jgi:hypothetical protein